MKADLLLRKREVPYRFVDLATLQADFWTDVETWRQRNEDDNA